MTLRHAVLGDLEAELEITRRALERVPEEKFDWRPHEKSYPLGTLAFHITNLLFWQKIALTEEGFDLASSPPPEKDARLLGKEELLRRFDDNAVALRGVIAEVTEERFGEPWSLRHGDQVIFTSPRADVLRRFGISHMIHHRGQLSLYLRLLDVPVPNTYGPTADES